jgi:butyrate kinase
MFILTINPGSTSTKIGIFNGSENALKEVHTETIRHDASELAAFPSLIAQLDFRRNLIEKAVENAGLNLWEFKGFVGRGGLLRPIESGVYKVNDDMLADLISGLQGEHASNLGGLLAHALARTHGEDAYIADPVVVDELCPEARVSGHPLIARKSIFHALNHKAIARKYCADNKLAYTDINLIIAHMGGGISVGAHERGRVVDVNDALNGDGPFTPERCGALPARQLIDLCFSGKHTREEVRAMIQPKGGLVAWFGINDFQKACELAQTDEKVRLVIDAMLYAVSKSIGSCAAALRGKIDAILLTGGLAYSTYLVDYITQRTSFIAPVRAYPGEDELLALASAVLRVLSGEEEAKEY